MRIIKLEGNVSVNMKGIICEELQDDMHVYVLLEGKTHLWVRISTHRLTNIVCLGIEDCLAEEAKDPNANKRNRRRWKGDQNGWQLIAVSTDFWLKTVPPLINRLINIQI